MRIYIILAELLKFWWADCEEVRPRMHQTRCFLCIWGVTGNGYLQEHLKRPFFAVEGSVVNYLERRWGRSSHHSHGMDGNFSIQHIFFS
jgi:hypothetical protein